MHMFSTALVVGINFVLQKYRFKKLSLCILMLSLNCWVPTFLNSTICQVIQIIIYNNVDLSPMYRLCTIDIKFILS